MKKFLLISSLKAPGFKLSLLSLVLLLCTAVEPVSAGLMTPLRALQADVSLPHKAIFCLS